MVPERVELTEFYADVVSTPINEFLKKRGATHVSLRPLGCLANARRLGSLPDDLGMSMNWHRAGFRLYGPGSRESDK